MKKTLLASAIAVAFGFSGVAFATTRTSSRFS